MTKQKTEAAAAARIGIAVAERKRDELLERLRPCFARIEPFLQARKYVRAAMSGLSARNGWSVAEFAGDESPDKSQRLLNWASWDAFGAMSEIRTFSVEGLEEAARRREGPCPRVDTQTLRRASRQQRRRQPKETHVESLSVRRPRSPQLLPPEYPVQREFLQHGQHQ